MCRSRRELSNEYLLAKFGFDTAENELSKVCLAAPQAAAIAAARRDQGVVDQVALAGSRLHRSRCLQVNMRLKALAEIYTIHSFAQLCNFNFSSKFVKNSTNNYWQNCQTDRADVNLRKSETRTEINGTFSARFRYSFIAPIESF